MSSSQREVFTISKDIYDAMLTAARKAAPLEACGLLGGNDHKAEKFYELTNTDASDEHYSMIPEEQFAAVKDMRANGISMSAIWHSHPATPPRMSDEDLQLAYTSGVAYIILSLADPHKPEIQGHEVNNGVPKEIQITIEEQ